MEKKTEGIRGWWGKRMCNIPLSLDRVDLLCFSKELQLLLFMTEAEPQQHCKLRSSERWKDIQDFWSGVKFPYMLINLLFQAFFKSAEVGFFYFIKS